MSDAAIQQASALLRNGQTEKASLILEEVIDSAPSDATVLRMLGTVRYMDNQLEEAIELLRRSLAVEPDNAKTLLNAGTVYLALEDFQQAESVFGRLIELEPDSIDAHFNLGVVYQRSGQPALAVGQFTRVLALNSNYIDAEINLAAACLMVGDLESSVQFSDSVLKRDPRNRQVQLSRATAHAQLGNMDEAGRQLRALMKESPGDQTLALHWGKHLAYLGRYDEARVALESVVRNSPSQLGAARSLAGVLYELGRFDEAVDVLTPMTASHERSAELWGQLGGALARLSRADETVDAFERSITLAPNSVACLVGYAQTLIEFERFDEAEPLLLRAARVAPQLAPAHVLLAQIRSRQGDYADALAICDDYLQRQPIERSALATRSLLLSALGRHEEAVHLADLERLVSKIELGAPAGYDDLASFNSALAEHVATHPSLVKSPQSHATQEGLHSGPLRVEPRGPIADLETVIYLAAQTYMKSLDIDADHPFRAQPRELGTLYCWGVVMRSQGHQTPHIHPAAWLSGIYYPQVPDVVETSPDSEGWLEFGCAPAEFGFTEPVPTRLVKPREGLLILFPSYFYHRTIPFAADQQRVSIAFDLFAKSNTAAPDRQWLANSLVSFA